MPPVTLVIPVFNEARSVEALPKTLAECLAHLPEGSDAIVVDDGSTDGSGELLERAAEGHNGLKIVRHSLNRGYGAALRTGIAAAKNDWIAIADADGTYPLAALPKLLAEIDAGADMAVGARRLGEQPAERRIAKVVLNGLASYLSGTRIPDINSGLRVFRKADAQRFRRLLPDGFSFTSTITMCLLGEGRRVEYLPVRYRTRVGSSKIRPVRDFGNFVMMFCRMALMFHPLKVFGPTGGGMIALGFLLLLVRAFLDQPFGVATTIILITAGLQILAIGLLADLINRRTGSDG